MIDAGTLDRRLVLEAPSETPDGSGGVVRGYVATAILWAAVTPVAARDAVVAAAGCATVTHRIVIRAGGDAGVTTRHRLRDGARVYAVVAVRPAARRRAVVEIDATERVE